jgi:ABC-2 type transport system permease protein
VLWLALFGNAFNLANIIPGGDAAKAALQSYFGGAPNYITFLTGGMICFLVVTGSMWAGGPLVMDRSLGYLDKLLATPVSRTAVTLSLVVSNIMKGLLMTVILLGVAFVMPGGLIVGNSFGVLDLLGIFATLILLGVGFLWLFMLVAVRATKFETLAAIGSTLGLPMLFASSALLPVSSMPNWLRAIADVNPISKAADIIRYLIIQGSLSGSAVTAVTNDFVYLGAFAVVCMAIGVYASKHGLRME